MGGEGLTVEDALQDCIQVACVAKIVEAWKVVLQSANVMRVGQLREQ